MIVRAGRLRLTIRLIASALALTVLTSSLSVVGSTVADAQEFFRRPSLLRDLFGFRRLRRIERPPEMMMEPVPQYQLRKPKPKARAPRPVTPDEPVIPILEKEPGSRVLLVIGDFMAAGLADGLNAVYAQNPKVRIIDRTDATSGLVRGDITDWPKKAIELIEDEKPAAVIVMLGANDRQQMSVDGDRQPARSEAWTQEYERRAEALAKAVSGKKVPMLWVGMPSFKSSKASTDFLALNEIYRSAAEGMKGEFVDIWDGFVDENGAYISTGPDVNGQAVRLRAGDGINMTGPGERKAAFYLEKPLAKILGGVAAPDVAALPELPLDKKAAKTGIRLVDRTPPISLKDPQLDGGTELLGRIVEPGVRSPSDAVLIGGSKQPGRADDFTWPKPAAPTSVPDKTGAIAP